MLRAALAHPLRSYYRPLRLRLGHALHDLPMHGRNLRVVPLMSIVQLPSLYLGWRRRFFGLFEHTGPDGPSLDAVTLLGHYPKLV